MVGFEKDVLLKFGALNLVVVDDHVFSKRFHGEIFLVVFLLDKEYFSKGASADDLDELEALKRNLGVVLFGIQSSRLLSHERRVHRIINSERTIMRTDRVLARRAFLESVFLLSAHAIRRYDVLANFKILFGGLPVFELVVGEPVNGQILAGELVVKIF